MPNTFSEGAHIRKMGRITINSIGCTAASGLDNESYKKIMDTAAGVAKGSLMVSMTLYMGTFGAFPVLLAPGAAVFAVSAGIMAALNIYQNSNDDLYLQLKDDNSYRKILPPSKIYNHPIWGPKKLDGGNYSIDPGTDKTINQTVDFSGSQFKIEFWDHDWGYDDPLGYLVWDRSKKAPVNEDINMVVTNSDANSIYSISFRVTM